VNVVTPSTTTAAWFEMPNTTVTGLNLFWNQVGDSGPQKYWGFGVRSDVEALVLREQAKQKPNQNFDYAPQGYKYNFSVPDTILPCGWDDNNTFLPCLPLNQMSILRQSEVAQSRESEEMLFIPTAFIEELKIPGQNSTHCELPLAANVPGECTHRKSFLVPGVEYGQIKIWHDYKITPPPSFYHRFFGIDRTIRGSLTVGVDSQDNRRISDFAVDEPISVSLKQLFKGNLKSGRDSPQVTEKTEREINAEAEKKIESGVGNKKKETILAEIVPWRSKGSEMGAEDDWYLNKYGSLDDGYPFHCSGDNQDTCKDRAAPYRVSGYSFVLEMQWRNEMLEPGPLLNVKPKGQNGWIGYTEAVPIDRKGGIRLRTFSGVRVKLDRIGFFDYFQLQSMFFSLTTFLVWMKLPALAVFYFAVGALGMLSSIYIRMMNQDLNMLHAFNGVGARLLKRSHAFQDLHDLKEAATGKDTISFSQAKRRMNRFMESRAELDEAERDYFASFFYSEVASISPETEAAGAPELSIKQQDLIKALSLEETLRYEDVLKFIDTSGNKLGLFERIFFDTTMFKFIQSSKIMGDSEDRSIFECRDCMYQFLHNADALKNLKKPFACPNCGSETRNCMLKKDPIMRVVLIFEEGARAQERQEMKDLYMQVADKAKDGEAVDAIKAIHEIEKDHVIAVNLMITFTSWIKVKHPHLLNPLMHAYLEEEEEDKEGSEASSEDKFAEIEYIDGNKKRDQLLFQLRLLRQALDWHVHHLEDQLDAVTDCKFEILERYGNLLHYNAHLQDEFTEKTGMRLQDVL